MYNHESVKFLATISSYNYSLDLELNPITKWVLVFQSMAHYCFRPENLVSLKFYG